MVIGGRVIRSESEGLIEGGVHWIEEAVVGGRVTERAKNGVTV